MPCSSTATVRTAKSDRREAGGLGPRRSARGRGPTLERSRTAQRSQPTPCSNAAGLAQRLSARRDSNTFHLRRQARAHLYRPCEQHPRRSCPSSDVRRRGSASARMAARAARPRDPAGPRRRGHRSMPAFRLPRPAHEAAVAEELLAGTRKYMSSRRTRSLPNSANTSARQRRRRDAYLGPISSRYLRALPGAAQEGLSAPLVMRSSGGVATVEEAAPTYHAVLVSGPAGGVSAQGSSRAARASRTRSRSTWWDVHRRVPNLEGGRGPTTQRTSAVCRCRVPTRRHPHGRRRRRIDRALDAGGATVSARRAPAQTRPGVLRAGGVADGDGREPAARPAAAELLGGDRARARRGSAARSRDSIRAAVVHRQRGEHARDPGVSVERGHDPRARPRRFGGAGPLHACELAEGLGMRAVLLPPPRGAVRARARRQRGAPRRVSSRISAGLPTPGRAPGGGHCRLALPRAVVRAVGTAPGEELAQAFHGAHEERYGYAETSRARSS